MLAQVLQIFLWNEHLVKNLLISTLAKVIYFKETILQRSTKPLSTSQNRVEISLKKCLPFFIQPSSSEAPKISMVYNDQQTLESRYVDEPRPPPPPPPDRLHNVCAFITLGVLNDFCCRVSP
jgi:hypothetical protein